jgi:hypothetical protein
MLDYCIYTLDENGHVTNRLDVKCPNDEVAKQCAKRFIDRQDIELWEGDRLVAVFETKA